MSARAFYSYAHSDNENSEGFVLRLADSLKKAYQLLSGEELALFVDRDEESGIRWGDAWRATIDGNLANASFFIPVLSPTYLMKPECRREFEEFQRAAKLERQERLILPVLLAEFTDEQGEDEIKVAAHALQWVDWSEMQLTSPQSSEYKTLVRKMARRLLNAQSELDAEISAGTSPAVVIAHAGGGEVSNDQDDDELLEVDRIAKAEERIQLLHATMLEMQGAMKDIGQAVSDATPDMQAARSFSHQLVVYQRLSGVLSPMVDRFYRFAKEYSDSILEADPGIRDLLRRVEESGPIMTPADPSASVDDLLRGLVDYSRISISNADSAARLMRSIAGIENKARSLRPAMRKLRTATAIIESTRPVFQVWLELGEELSRKQPPASA